MSRGHFIGLNKHRLMLADGARMEAYQRAIEAVVEPGMRVMDLGTGTGILALWAARAGAEVVAVEPHDVIEVAKRMARDNGLADRITFVRGDSQTLSLERPVDLVVTECMGNFFVTDEMQPVLRDLPRHLAPGGRTLPRRISLHLAAAMLPFWQEMRFWDQPVGGFDFSGAKDLARQVAYVVATDPELLATEPAEVASFPLVEAPDELMMAASLEVTRSRTLDAVVGWFEADLAEGVTLSTRPGTRTHWGQMAFVVPSVPVVAGDRVDVSVELHMDPTLKSHFIWRGEIVRPGRETVPFRSDTRDRFVPAAKQ